MTDFDYNDAPWRSVYYDVKNVIIENGVTSIGDFAFTNCFGIIDITIPDSVTRIGTGAFTHCNFDSITIPDSVTSIDYLAFSGCTNLAHIVLPASSNITKLSSLLSATGSPFLTSAGPKGSGNYAIEYGWTDTIPEDAFAGFTALTEVTFPETITTIEEGAFSGCTGLTQAKNPSAVTTIGANAFYGCTKLKELDIPASVIRINLDGVFERCTELENITVAPSNTVYASRDGALFNKEKTVLYRVPEGKSNFTIPTGVTKIESRAFYSCAGLTEIVIPASVTSIAENAFVNCSGLTQLVIPEGAPSAWYNFTGCTKLVEVTLPGTAECYYGVSGPSLTTIRISEGVKCLDGTFSGLTTLTNVYLPASLTEIRADTFANCSNLKNVTFAGTQAQWDTLTIADGNQELCLATVICTGTGSEIPGTGPETPVGPVEPNTPGSLDVSSTSGGLGHKLTVQVQSGHWLTVQTRRAGSVAISAIQAPTGAGGVVSVTFSAPGGSAIQIWETENELAFVNGVPTNTILKTVVKQL